MKRVILTDLGNVLVSFADRGTVLAKFISKLGGEPSAMERIYEPERAAGLTGEAVYDLADTGKISFEEHRLRVNRHSGLQISPERLAAIGCRNLEAIKPVVELFKEISGKFPVVAVSNGNWGSRHVVDYLSVYHDLDFAESFISFEHGIKKPGLLDVVVSWMAGKGLEPEEAVFVDDIMSYCQAAEQRGIDSVCFNAASDPVEKLRTAFVRFGLM